MHSTSENRIIYRESLNNSKVDSSKLQYTDTIYNNFAQGNNWQYIPYNLKPTAATNNTIYPSYIHRKKIEDKYCK